MGSHPYGTLSARRDPYVELRTRRDTIGDRPVTPTQRHVPSALGTRQHRGESLVHVTPASSDVTRVTRAPHVDGQQSRTILIVSDGAPPHALIERACGSAGGSTRFVRRSTWQPLVTDDAEPLPHDAVVVIATLLTCGKAHPWRGTPRFQEVMRRTILVAPLRQDAGVAMVAACGLGGFVALSDVSTHLSPAVRDLFARTVAARPRTTRRFAR